MRSPLDELNDFELCNRVFLMIGERYGEQIDLNRENEAEQTVTLSWHVSGIVGNGGFEFLFEGTIHDDPNYRLSAQALRRIGCARAAESLEAAIAAASLEGRISHVKYLDVPTAERGRLDGTFFDDTEDLPARLATFIRAREVELRL